MRNDVPNFRETIFAAGLEPPHYIEPGRFHRFPGLGKRPSNRSGWCLLFPDGLGGCFGDWSSGLFNSWHTNRAERYSQSEKEKVNQLKRAAKQKAAAERSSRQAEAALRAAEIWNASTCAPTEHPYLIKKRIQPFSAKANAGLLILPVTDFSGSLTSLQFIGANGSKRLLAGGRKQGCRIVVAGDLLNPKKIIICEGWATGCTLSQSYPTALVLAAIDAGNLEPVATAAACRWTSSKLVIAGDDDRLTDGNPGATKANAAAIASGALLALPNWPEGAPTHLTDFNDLAVWLSGEDQ